MSKSSTLKSELEQLQDRLINRVEDAIQLYGFEREDVANTLGMFGNKFRNPPDPNADPRYKHPASVYEIEQMESFLKILDTVRQRWQRN